MIVFTLVERQRDTCKAAGRGPGGIWYLADLAVALTHCRHRRGYPGCPFALSASGKTPFVYRSLV